MKILNNNFYRARANISESVFNNLKPVEMAAEMLGIESSQNESDNSLKTQYDFKACFVLTIMKVPDMCLYLFV